MNLIHYLIVSEIITPHLT